MKRARFKVLLKGTIMKTNHIKKVKPVNTAAGTLTGTICIPNETVK